MLVTAAGERFWPSLGSNSPAWPTSIRQCQLAQVEYDLVEARLVSAAALSAEQEGALRTHIQSRLPAGFRVSFVYRDEIERGAGGKNEGFVCEIVAGGRGGLR